LQNRLQTYGQQLINAADADMAALGQLHQQLGETHDDLARYTEAEVHYRAAAHCFEAANLMAQAALNYITSGELQAQLGEVERSVKSFNLALSIGESLSDRSIQARSLYSLGRLKEDEGDLENALSDYQQAESLIGQVEPTDETAVLTAAILSSIAAVQVEIVIQQALRLAEQINRSFEDLLESAPDPVDPGDGDSSGITPESPPIELPTETRASRLPRPRPPRWR
jgi:tetratricopeptide (TPR) repeat protein